MKNEVEITYEEFEKYLKNIEAIIQLNDSLCDLENEYQKKTKEEMSFSFWFPTMITSVVELLSKVFEDEGEWIGYWIWELDCGKKYKDGDVTFYGQNVPLKTIEDLWNVLIGNLADKRANCEYYEEKEEMRRVGTFCYPVRAGKCKAGQSVRNCFCNGDTSKCDK